MTGVSVWGGGAATSGFAGFDFADEEVPAGAITGVNAVFTLANIPNPLAGLQLYVNGNYQTQGIDYNLTGAGNQITYLAGAIPQLGDAHVCNYRY